ncbi:MAG TPA: 16S rRNA (guanine(966)-N(2))-methyltransferase RsmD [Candidatus Deferrimicrobiaceae bacterium]|jgi:16S rRNA (guanine(966)-N(2))-methyltransferase RsmD|nr:16S rRNA (guanine(966)-N(2))-methyltransferase RsmD [Candidatus Deferrimicrobiaceae bacterium]
MRVIAGKYRGHPLRTLHGKDTRPTSDRLRETLFNVLTAGNPAALAGTVWLDLFAGTGAVGIEALSRGAKQVFFVETSAFATKVIEQNLQTLKITQGYRILRDDLSGVLWHLKREHITADVVFLDPPYRMHEAYESSLTALADSALVWAMSLVIAEHAKKFDPGAEFESLRRVRKLVQGNNALSFYRIGGRPDLNDK